jgi:hypothetical protein
MGGWMSENQETDATDIDLVPPVEAPVDEPPKDGVWADEHPPLTDEEIAAGNHLGATIDPDDDNDNGLGCAARSSCRRAARGPVTGGWRRSTSG